LFGGTDGEPDQVWPSPAVTRPDARAGFPLLETASGRKPTQVEWRPKCTAGAPGVGWAKQGTFIDALPHDPDRAANEHEYRMIVVRGDGVIYSSPGATITG
jgi:hypothetical protein